MKEEAVRGRTYRHDDDADFLPIIYLDCPVGINSPINSHHVLVTGFV